MEIRRAGMGDLDGIMDIIAQAQAFLKSRGVDQWQDGDPRRELVVDDINKGVAYVIEIDGELAASGAVRLTREKVYDEMSDGKWLTRNTPYAVINRTAVSDKYRGRGIGKLLLSELEKLAEDLPCNSIRVDTHEDNTAMRALLEKHGFIHCGKVFWEGPENPRAARVVYEKVLASGGVSGGSVK